MAVGDIITAARFNLLQGRIANILGTGSGDSGYGQSLASSAVNVGDTITAEILNNIFQDMLNARVHQTGAIPTTLKRVNVGDIIAENTSTNPDGNLKGLSDYEDLIALIEADKFLLDSGQATEEAAVSDTRTLEWNGIITHEVKASWFLGEARHFFNSGGEIRFSANLSGGSGAKTTDWTQMLSTMGTIKFNYTQTTADSGSGSNIGFYDLTDSYQTIFIKTGSGIYSNNQYSIEAKLHDLDANSIWFRIRFNDPAYPSIDENINGQLTSSIRTLRASGVYVSVFGPIITNETTL